MRQESPAHECVGERTFPHLEKTEKTGGSDLLYNIKGEIAAGTGFSRSARLYRSQGPGITEEKHGSRILQGRRWGNNGSGRVRGSDTNFRRNPPRTVTDRGVFSPKIFKMLDQQMNRCPFTDRPTHRPTDRPTDRPADPPTDRPTGEDRPTDPPNDRPIGRPTSRPTDLPADRARERPTCRSTHRPTVRPAVQPTDRPTDRPTVRPTDRRTV